MTCEFTHARRSARRMLSLSALSLLITGTALHAGPITPPPGPVAGTPGPEPRIAINATNTPGDADSLFKLTQPGSYYVTGNITGVAGKHGIEIAASGVTLDLNGFDLVGVAGSLDGVSTTVGSLTNIAVVSGSVRNWGNSGVDLATVGARNCRVDGVLASGNAGNGIGTGDSCTVSNCSAYLNTGSGISTGSGCTVTACTSSNNTGSGLGIGSYSTCTNCSTSNNSLSGIFLTFGGTATNCSVYGNNANGIDTGTGCTVVDCTARSNLGDGIKLGFQSSASGCTSTANLGDGIEAPAECALTHNTCSDNGKGSGPNGAGIHATGNDNRIEGNNCTGSDVGIDVGAASGNIIIRNTCSGNSIVNWNIAANNVCGPILDRTAPASGAIFGNAASSSLGTTDANANFTY